MAKHKNSTALFEVIHSAKKPPKTSPNGGIATPKWWFKSKKLSVDPVAAPPEPRIISQPVEPAVEPPPRIIERIIEKPVYIDRPVIVEKPAAVSRFTDDLPAEDWEPAPMRIGADQPIRLDKGSREIKFRLSYPGVVAMGFVIVLIIAIAYLAGTRSPQPSYGDDVPPTDTTSAHAKTTATGFLAASQPQSDNSSSTASNTTPQDAPVNVVTPTAPTPPPAAVSPGKVVRQVGLHYIIAQSYPNQETALKACDFLNKAGIGCTVVEGPTGWAVHNWYSVVGVKSFDHVQHNPELDSYEATIESLGVKFSGNNRFNRFEPRAYKWREGAEETD
jgi:hypothetical protein